MRESVWCGGIPRAGEVGGSRCQRSRGPNAVLEVQMSRIQVDERGFIISEMQVSILESNPLDALVKRCG